MILQIVNRIIGGTDHGDLEFVDDPQRREILKMFVCLFPDSRGGRLVEKLGNIKITLQLEMRPMIERVADSGRNGLGVSEKLVVVASVAGDKTLGHSMSPHRSPLVMIPISAVV